MINPFFNFFIMLSTKLILELFKDLPNKLVCKIVYLFPYSSTTKAPLYFEYP